MLDDIDVTEPLEKRIARAVESLGGDTVVSRALSLLAGNNEGESFLLVVGGEHARGVLDGAPVLYWPELWGIRALLYVWNDSAAAGVAAGLRNQSWRVREMATRVAVERGLVLRDELAELLTDEVPRVRAGAARAMGMLADDASAVRVLLADPDVDVRRAAGEAAATIDERSRSSSE